MWAKLRRIAWLSSIPIIAFPAVLMGCGSLVVAYSAIQEQFPTFVISKQLNSLPWPLFFVYFVFWNYLLAILLPRVVFRELRHRLAAYSCIAVMMLLWYYTLGGQVTYGVWQKLGV